MGMNGVLGTALQGLKVITAGLDVVSRNVANADTPGYTRKTIGQTSLVMGANVTGVVSGDVKRQVDDLLVRQIRQENAGLGYVRILNSYYTQLDNIYAEPGSSVGVDTLFSAFRNSMAELAATPDSYIAREQVLRDAQVLASRLNQMSADIQAMRLEAERGIGDAVQRVNELLNRISEVNQQIGSSPQIESPPADLLDLRDNYIAELSELLDIRVIERQRGVVSIMTQSGMSLLDPLPAQLVFDERGMVTAQSLYNSDASLSGVGTIKIVTPNGGSIDLIADNQIRSGKIAALLELRDKYLVDAQAQLDAIADGLARALSTNSVASGAVTSGTQQGREIDLAGIQPGDRISMTVTVDGVQRKLTLIPVTDPAALPLPDNVTPERDDVVIGFDISGGMATAAAQIEAALGGAIQVSAPGGDILRFLDDGAGQTTSSGVGYGLDGSTLDLSALAGQSITVSVGGTDYSYAFTATSTGQDLQAFIDAIPGIGASIVAGDLVISGDTPATGFSISFSDPSVGLATGLAEGSHNTSSIDALSAGITATDFTSGLGIPLFVDGGFPYTGNLDAIPQQLGFAGRISVNPALLNDNALLVRYGSGTMEGDPARPAELLRRLSEAVFTFAPETKVAGSTPYTGTLGGFIQRVISYQGAMASDVYKAASAQEMVSAQLQERFVAESGVNIDQEMANLIELQTAYQANARIVTAFREMMDLLLRV
ncbi:flagellar hook-associated protein FlgK [Tepidamorphus gemmatus]|uniref:Flagellar hook-associated protein 1 n=1 Tax=Tepidamorphus gemmatus TaxID=747076 RepID=A0A4R3M0F5_9HYPH|nr:flagellar hook-associated protein FlgK [Tepidamorphus gemmatus]TCT06462.1 flagellar hook-associated protein FlgK [Tepidamorphus gemmatus]